MTSEVPVPSANMRLLVSSLCLICILRGFDASAAESSPSKICGIDQSLPAQRIFANPDGKHGWHEYRTVKEVPELENGLGGFAQLWVGQDGGVLISTQEPGEDFAAYTDYCFNAEGQLVRLRYQLRTAWGWGYREEGAVSNGTVKRKISEFFDIQTEKSIAKPEQADDIPDALKPTLHLRKSELPFFKLISKR